MRRGYHQNGVEAWRTFSKDAHQAPKRKAKKKGQPSEDKQQFGGGNSCTKWRYRKACPISKKGKYLSRLLKNVAGGGGGGVWKRKKKGFKKLRQGRRLMAKRKFRRTAKVPGKCR